MHKFRGDSTFATWAHRIAHNMTVSYLRKHREQLTDPVELDLVSSTVSHKQVEAGRLLQQIAAGLTDEEITLLQQFKNEMTSTEIGAEVGQSRKYVERRWAALRGKIRRLCA